MVGIELAFGHPSGQNGHDLSGSANSPTIRREAEIVEKAPGHLRRPNAIRV